MAKIDTEYIRENVRKSGVTWRYVSERTGISPSSLSLKINNKVGWTLDDVIVMSRYLGCTVERLVKE